MRELHPWAVRSQGREHHRDFYSAYMRSPDWYRRRTRWVEEERDLQPQGVPISCIGCRQEWRSTRDDLHHVSYDRLGDETHEDLWPMCRPCHSWVHELMVSTKTWRRLPRRTANTLALQQLHAALDERETGGANWGVLGLRSFL